MFCTLLNVKLFSRRNNRCFTCYLCVEIM
uniref:Uncharacterized protein n=1 Tax=Arundo donax TaxID=35708 RepID=A0A0A9CG35_ARUDO